MKHRCFRIGFGVLWFLFAAAALGLEWVHCSQLTIRWETETEVNTAGFNLYRAPALDGPFTKINTNPILAQGDPLLGASYEYLDRGVQPNRSFYYRLEEVEFDGQTNQASLVIGKTPRLRASVASLATLAVVVGILLSFSGFREKMKHSGNRRGTLGTNHVANS